MNALIAGLLACGCVSLIDAPLWPPASDYISSPLDCGQSRNARCETTRKNWAVDYGNAIAGEYGAQKTVALCFSTGCEGAIKIDRMLGCAWGKVAIHTAHMNGDDSEADSLRRYCLLPYLDAAGEQAAEVEASSLRQMFSVK